LYGQFSQNSGLKLSKAAGCALAAACYNKEKFTAQSALPENCPPQVK
jgi:hypothetical protein